MKAWTCRAWISGLALAALPALSGQSGGVLAPITLYSEFAKAPPQAVKAALQDELDSIMTPMGLRFEWRDLHGPKEAPAIELVVVSFKGRCDVAGLSQHIPGTAGPLGWTHISDGVILPFSDVDCDEIRVFLQRALLGVSVSDREGTFGRALGRVVAHELYHIFADTTRHGSCGVGKEAYTVHDLLTAAFRFEDKETQAMRNSKAYESLGKGLDLRY